MDLEAAVGVHQLDPAAAVRDHRLQRQLDKAGRVRLAGHRPESQARPRRAASTTGRRVVHGVRGGQRGLPRRLHEELRLQVQAAQPSEVSAGLY